MNAMPACAAAGARPRLSAIRILQMNLGFLGLQFSFGLQQANMGPIYSYLGANEASLPLLQLAGPVTGLLVQPLVGAMSDRTASRLGRRTPYFILGALMCSIGLFLMPLSSSLLMAVSLLWIIDAGNNMTMDPYRAYVKDRLNPDQQPLGFFSQSAFTGLAQTLAFLTPSLLVHGFGMDGNALDNHNIPHITRIAFTIGAVLSLVTILWSIWRVPELPLTDDERARIAALPKSVGATLGEIGAAIRDMPAGMRRLAWMSLFQWYGMTCYWAYVTYSISRTVHGTSDPLSSAFRDAVLTNGQVGAFYNAVACVAAFGLAALSRRHRPARLHALCLLASGLGMLVIPHVGEKTLLFLPAIGIGLGWASMMGLPHAMLAATIPPERTGVYMGIFNLFIVIPMLLFAVTMPLAYDSLLGGDARNAISLSGALMLTAALLVPRTPRSAAPHRG